MNTKHEYSVSGHGLGILAVYGGQTRTGARTADRLLTRVEAWEIARKLGPGVVFRANHSVNGWKGRDVNGAPVKVEPLPYDLP